MNDDDEIAIIMDRDAEGVITYYPENDTLICDNCGFTFDDHSQGDCPVTNNRHDDVAGKATGKPPVS